MVREGAGPEYLMTVLDLKRRISTTIDRSNLLRIGTFTKWFDLAHALRAFAGRVPTGPHRGTVQHGQSGRAIRLVSAGAAGRRFEHLLERAQPVAHVDRARQGRDRLGVTGVDRKPVREQVFAIDDRGFVRNDANQDIERD